MFLYKKRVKGKKINHQINNLKEKIAPEQLESLVLRLRMGDQSVINEIVEGHLRLIINIASQYAAYTGDDGLDYISEGFLAAVMILRKKLNDNQVTGLIACAVHRRISHYIDRARHKKKHEGISTTPKFFQDRGSNQDETLSVGLYSSQFEKAVEGDYGIHDIREVMDKVCETDQEKQIMKLREYGYTDQEIGNQVGLCNTKVYRIRQSIRRRFDGIT